MKELVPKRDETLKAEFVRQQNNETLRRDFANLANGAGQWIESRLDTVASLGLEKGTLEEHLAKLRALEAETVEYRPKVKELEDCNQEVQKALIFENKHTQYTMEVNANHFLSYVLMFKLYLDTVMMRTV
jgi:actinin alpha 1/4